MKATRYIGIAAVGFFALASCSKSYLNAPTPSDGSIPATLIFNSAIGVNNALTGIYETMRDYIPSSGQQNMYGWKTSQLNFDMRGDDMISDPSNWWLFENEWADDGYGRIATAARNLQIWNLNYKVINNANSVIAYTYQIPDGISVKEPLIGEAYALRAWAYFNLARIYQFAYSKDSTAPGVPIYTTPSGATTGGNPRAPLSQVYALIVSDLDSAINDLTTDRVDKYRINKNVAQGILAQVYAEMALGDPSLWPLAQSNASAAAQGFPLMDATGYNDGFNSVTNGEWMWGLQFNASQSLSYASFFGYIEPVAITGAAARYNDLYINSATVSLFTATDMRNLFQPAPNQSSSTPWKQWVTLKFQDNATQSGDYVMMRSAEMILIQAEALAHQGQLQPAEDMLYSLQSERDPSAIEGPATSLTTLVNQILIERRKELYAEEGVQYFDLKRYQLPLVRDGNQWSLLNIPATDNRWRWQIPQTEMDANRSLSASDQNPL